jgi:predicted amidophosphoribosyltransferase
MELMFKVDHTKHLREYTEAELLNTICEYCLDPEMNMAEYMCPNCSKDNEIICVECCGCFDEEEWLMANS